MAERGYQVVVVNRPTPAQASAMVAASADVLVELLRCADAEADVLAELAELAELLRREEGAA